MLEVVARFPLFRDGGDTGRTLGWLLFAPGLVVALAGFAAAIGLVVKGHRIAKARSLGRPRTPKGARANPERREFSDGAAAAAEPGTSAEPAGTASGRDGPADEAPTGQSRSWTGTVPDPDCA